MKRQIYLFARQSMFDYCVYLLYRAGIWVLSLAPLPVLFGLGQIAGMAAWTLLPHYRRLAYHNITLALGDELTKSERQQAVRRHFQRLGANLLSSIKLSQLPAKQILQRVEVHEFAYIEDCLAQKQPLILLLSHTGPWEVWAHLLPQFIVHQRKSTVYQRLRNRFIDEHLRQTRARFGIEMFERSAGFSKAIDLLRGGGAIGILTDQHAGDSGVWTPFFGRLASTTPLPALLAKRTGARIIALAFRTSGYARWRAIAQPPLCVDASSVESLTAAANQIIEAQVRQAPEDWFWVHNRWKTPTPNFLLTRYKRGVFIPKSVALKPFRILIRSSNWLGDAIMSVPAVQAIKAGRPDAHVTILAPQKIAPIWNIIAEVDQVIPVKSTSLLRTVHRIRELQRFDAAVVFPNSLRSALEVLLAGVPRRVGFPGHMRKWLLNQRPRRTRRRGIVHQTSRYLQLAAAIGARVQRQFAPAKPLAQSGQRLQFGLCPGAEYGPAKRWLPERFFEVARQIAAELNVHWIIFGTRSDIPVAEEIAQKLNGACQNRVGQTTLQQLAAELQSCDLLLTNDTGTMHLAAMLRVPTIAIFGSTEPLRTAPLGPGHRILRHHVECSPCFLRHCPLDFRCMRAITTREVISTIRQMIPVTRPKAPFTR